MGKYSEKHLFLTLTEAAEYNRVSRQGVLMAVKKGRIKAGKIKGRWSIAVSELDNYRLTKYDRSKRKFEGEQIYDIEKGFFSVRQVSISLSNELKTTITMQMVYYMIHSGKLKSYKKGAAWVIKREDAIAMLERLRGENKNQLRFA